MDCLRNFVLYCLRNEWITKNPFRYYKLKEDEVQAKEHLTAHELELLTRKALDHRLARIRDVFVFCCLTGLAFADADQLRREHISQDDEGRWWIHKPREKTSVMSRIPLLPIPLEILRRYEHDEVCVARSRVVYGNVLFLAVKCFLAERPAIETHIVEVCPSVIDDVKAVCACLVPRKAHP